MARTKAAKLRRKGGRPRKEGKRTPSGRLSRAGEKDDVMATALGARARRYGVDLTDARDARWGTAVGRLAIAGTISAAGYATVLKFLNLRNDALKAIQAPGRPKTRTASSGDSSSDEYAAWCNAVIDRYDNVLQAVLEVPPKIVHGNRFLSAPTTLSTVIVEDQYQDWMLPQLQAVISALQGYFANEAEGEKAA